MKVAGFTKTMYANPTTVYIPENRVLPFDDEDETEFMKTKSGGGWCKSLPC